MFAVRYFASKGVNFIDSNRRIVYFEVFIFIWLFLFRHLSHFTLT
ncbi:hypothetical protein OR214_02130 [Ralstonia pickettii OR214]|uniref:Uncharacterized protein n=2 Tax=Ralstonia pickettii TaxID=329 RepID=R0E6U0_RALPI|nr:hypothetical protein OR214_02130 [Ralstonia pickettii OR214]